MSRIQLASLGAGVAQDFGGAVRPSAPGTITFHATGLPVPVYATETAVSPDTSGGFITDQYGRVPGWVDQSLFGQQVDVHVPPATAVTVMLGVGFTAVTASNPGDAITGHSASTQSNAANTSRNMLAYFNLDPAAVIYGVLGAGPAVLNRGFVIYPAGDWNTPRDTGGIVWLGSIYLISTIDAITVARVEL